MGVSMSDIVYKKVDVVCNCGYKFITKSTVKSDTIRADICFKCSPLFTGQNKLIDYEGKLARFKKRYGDDSKYYG